MLNQTKKLACPLWVIDGHKAKKKGRHLGAQNSSARLVHIELAHRHHKVMRLVVPALNHDAHKAERL